MHPVLPNVIANGTVSMNIQSMRVWKHPLPENFYKLGALRLNFVLILITCQLILQRLKNSDDLLKLSQIETHKNLIPTEFNNHTVK